MATLSETDYKRHNEARGGKLAEFKKHFSKKPDKLQGRKRKTKYYFNDKISRQSIIFLGLATFQAVVVISLMVPIIALGDYTSDLVINNQSTVYDDLTCKERENLRKNIDMMDFSNVTEPTGLGQDKLIYVILFMCVVVYNVGLLFYALWFQSILEVGAFVLLNILVTIYACVQVHQFRGVTSEDGTLTTVGYFALGNALFLFFMTILFSFMFHYTYFEFGWKMYKKIRRSEWRFYYRWYQTLMSLGKLTVLFIVIFELGQCILFLDHCDPEFYFSILIMIVAIAILICSYFIVRREKRYLTVGLGISLFLLGVYLIFKIVRFSTRSCPLCRLRNELPFSEREQTFEHLIMLAVINLIITILTFLVLIVVYHNYGKGLRDQFMNPEAQPNTTNPHEGEKRHNMEETDTHPRPDSNSGPLLEPPSLEAGVDSSLQRNVQDYFKRQATAKLSQASSIPKKQEIQEVDNEENSINFEVVLSSNGIANVNGNVTPPPPRPQELLFKQKSSEHTEL